MYAKLRQAWPVVKVILKAGFCLVLAFFIGWRFYKDLARPELRQVTLEPIWLVLGGVLYLLGFACSALYWRRLLFALQQTPSLAATMRAYYLGQLGKYIPGKAWALLMRANLIHADGVRRGLATLTSLYEVLTTMASGALVALVLFGVFGRDTVAFEDWDVLWQMIRLDPPDGAVIARKISMLMSFLLLCAIGIPILPPFFNWLVHHVSLPFRAKTSPAPRFRMTSLLEGVALTSVGWLLLGASLLAVLRGTLAAELPWTWAMAGRILAVMALAYVGGFVVLFVPGGLGAREYVLVFFLTPELMVLLDTNAKDACFHAEIAAIILRLVWTVAELVCAAGLYWLPVKKIATAMPQAAGETS